MNPHLVLVVSVCALAARGLSRHYLELFGRQRVRALELYSRLFSHALYLCADAFQRREVGACELYSCCLWHLIHLLFVRVVLFGDVKYDACADRCSHVTKCESTNLWKVFESLYRQRPDRLYLDDGRVACL